eukprot:3800761-Rhodomonas_salina.1
MPCGYSYPVCSRAAHATGVWWFCVGHVDAQDAGLRVQGLGLGECGSSIGACESSCRVSVCAWSLRFV